MEVMVLASFAGFFHSYQTAVNTGQNRFRLYPTLSEICPKNDGQYQITECPCPWLPSKKSAALRVPCSQEFMAVGGVWLALDARFQVSKANSTKTPVIESYAFFSEGEGRTTRQNVGSRAIRAADKTHHSESRHGQQLCARLAPAEARRSGGGWALAAAPDWFWACNPLAEDGRAWGMKREA